MPVCIQFARGIPGDVAEATFLLENTGQSQVRDIKRAQSKNQARWTCPEKLNGRKHSLGA